MPKLTRRNPAYQCHRASGQAVVTLHGRDHYLGPHGTRTSRNEYDRLIGEWLANGRRLKGGPSDLTVVELAAAYWRHAKDYYRGADPGRGHLASYRLALSHVRRLYGRTPAADFGPLALKAVRDSFVAAGWSRNYVNAQAGRVRRMFRWGVANEMVPASVLHGLQALEGLRAGRSDAPEPEPVRPVPEDRVQAVRPHVSRQVWAMIELQALTGMRPGEVCALRSGDVDTTGRLWLYTPPSHKTKHLGHARTIYFGPRAQKILGPWLRPTLGEYVFRPDEAEADRRAKLTAARKTPACCGNLPGDNRERRPRKSPGDRYTVGAYRRAIAAACEEAFTMPADLREPRRPRKQRGGRKVPASAVRGPDVAARREARKAWRAANVWNPNQLRHNAGTRLRRDFGLEAAQVILGHATLRVTQVYAARNVAAAQKIMAEVG